MSAIDIAIIVVVSVLFAGALGYVIYRKLKGKNCCDCSSCAMCDICKQKENNTTNDKTK